MTKLIFLAAMVLTTAPLAMHSEKLTINAPKAQSSPCPLSLIKRVGKEQVRYCVFVKIIGDNNGNQLSVDTILLLAQEIIHDDSPLEASRLYSQMAELPGGHITFKITVIMDVLVILDTL